MTINIKNINNANSFKLEPDNSPESKLKQRNIKLKEKAREMESIFLSQMIKAMRKTIPENPWSKSKSNLPSMMFSSVMGKAMTKSGGIGLADEIYNSLKNMDDTQLQELQDSQSKVGESLNLNTLNFIKNIPGELENE